ncbi:hypothetical protein NM688_g9073 [Phlebia brevispora]|uniref:Uncharacterized protein n=1 Tax=Phlebia brevispora TaxID=194682 RepID=A0ACC1RP26_9APHY|nr:hypothetical protein NM688_g9073 [Phlebia brevispora]
MSILPDGKYSMQNLAFPVILGLTDRPTYPAADHEVPKAADLPLQVAVVQVGYAPVPSVVTKRPEDGLYEIVISDHQTFPLVGTVCAQTHQPFAWTLKARPDVGPDVHTVHTGARQWYLPAGTFNTPLSLKVPPNDECECDDKNKYMFNFSPWEAPEAVRGNRV